MLKKILIGFALIVASVLSIYISDGDANAAILGIPMGICYMFCDFSE